MRPLIYHFTHVGMGDTNLGYRLLESLALAYNFTEEPQIPSMIEPFVSSGHCCVCWDSEIAHISHSIKE